MPPPRQVLRGGQYGVLALALLVLTVYGSIIPLRYQPIPFEQALAQLRQAPLHNPLEAGPRADWMVNLIQYALLLYCFMGWASVDRGRLARALATLFLLPAGVALAIGTELLQVYFPPRTVALNDILVEGLGAIAGVAAWLLVGQALTDWGRGFWHRKGLTELARQGLPAYVAVLLIVAAMPFDFVLGAEELAAKSQEGRIEWVPFARWAREGIAFAFPQVKTLGSFFVFGALFALGKARRGPWEALGAATLLALAIEALQLVVYTRHCEATDLITGPIGAVLGLGCIRRLQRDREVPVALSRVRVGAADPQWAPLAIAWLVLLIVVHLHPFNFSTNPTDFQLSSPNLSDENTRIIGLRRVSLAPFVGYYWGSRYQALDNIARCLVSFAPLGVLLALAFGRREGEGELTTLAIAVFTAVGIEAAQYFIPERHPDVTDVLLHVAGAWLGYRGARHLLRALDAPSKEKVEEPAPPPLMALVPVPAVAGLWHPTLGAPPESAPRAKARPPLHLPRPYHRGWLSNLDQLPFWAGALVLGAIGLGLFTLALLILRVLD